VKKPLKLQNPTQDMKNLLLITTTVENKEDAERIATLLLEHRLIACAQISAPITSIYRWQDEVITATEVVLGVKTLPQHYTKIKELILQEHPYQLPEIIGQETDMVSDAYRNWVKGEVS
jgi:periplasmic divalent cation tolerance protein